MVEIIEANWLLVVIALVIGIMVAWWVFAANRKTKVELENTGEDAGPAKRNQALMDAPPAAAVAPAPAPSATPDTGDDLSRIKGLGPKLRAQMSEMGITTYAQIAAWDDAEIDRVDAEMGKFQGRIRRDNWTEQAKLLSAGDMDAYTDRFGQT